MRQGICYSLFHHRKYYCYHVVSEIFHMYTFRSCVDGGSGLRLDYGYDPNKKKDKCPGIATSKNTFPLILSLTVPKRCFFCCSYFLRCLRFGFFFFVFFCHVELRLCLCLPLSHFFFCFGLGGLCSLIGVFLIYCQIST